MRILITSAGPLTSQIGGGQSYVQDIAVGLHSLGHDVVLIEPVFLPESNVILQHWLWQNMPVCSVNLSAIIENQEESSSGLGQARLTLLGSLLQQYQPDVVHINSLISTMVRACVTNDIPHLVVAHHPGEVCPKGDLLTADDTICTQVPSPELCGPCVMRCQKRGHWVGKLLGAIPMRFYRKWGASLVNNNRLGYVGRVLTIPWLAEQRLNGLKSYLCEAQHIIAPSQAIATALIRAGAGSAHVQVIHHGIQPLNRRPLVGLGERPLRFGFVGRIDHAKGLHVLMKAMHLANLKGRAELHIHGDAVRPADRAEWEQLLAEFEKPAWLFLHGKFERDHVEEVYASIDVVVLPAIYLEVFGLVVAEAMCAGRPVLVTNCGGPSEQVQVGIDGWVVPPNDVLALAQVLVRLAAQPQLVEAAARATRINKSHCQYITELELVYRVLLEKNGSCSDSPRRKIGLTNQR